MYVGLITPRKGTDVLAQALEIAWREAPEIEMIWAGKAIVPGEMEGYRELWGHRAAQVHWLGAVVRPSLHAIVRSAVAVVVPSRADNLPNAAIESLTLGVPVIGSRGASIDEIVDDGCGELVAVGDAPALAAALLRAWRGEAAWNRNGFIAPSRFAMMEPSLAAENLLQFVSQHAR
jgi:glycosyltransferase involved in cell wall biosynthesis